MDNAEAPGGGVAPRQDERFAVEVGDRNLIAPGEGVAFGHHPGGVEGFFRESGRPALNDGPTPPLDHDEIARTQAAAPKYGLKTAAFDDSNRGAPTVTGA